MCVLQRNEVVCICQSDSWKEIGMDGVETEIDGVDRERERERERERDRGVVREMG